MKIQAISAMVLILIIISLPSTMAQEDSSDQQTATSLSEVQDYGSITDWSNVDMNTIDPARMNEVPDSAWAQIDQSRITKLEVVAAIPADKIEVDKITDNKARAAITAEQLAEGDNLQKFGDLRDADRDELKKALQMAVSSDPSRVTTEFVLPENLDNALTYDAATKTLTNGEDRNIDLKTYTDKPGVTIEAMKGGGFIVREGDNEIDINNKGTIKYIGPNILSVNGVIIDLTNSRAGSARYNPDGVITLPEKGNAKKDGRSYTNVGSSDALIISSEDSFSAVGATEVTDSKGFSFKTPNRMDVYYNEEGMDIYGRASVWDPKGGNFHIGDDIPAPDGAPDLELKYYPDSGNIKSVVGRQRIDGKDQYGNEMNNYGEKITVDYYNTGELPRISQARADYAGVRTKDSQRRPDETFAFRGDTFEEDSSWIRYNQDGTKAQMHLNDYRLRENVWSVEVGRHSGENRPGLGVKEYFATKEQAQAFLDSLKSKTTWTEMLREEKLYENSAAMINLGDGQAAILTNNPNQVNPAGRIYGDRDDTIGLRPGTFQGRSVSVTVDFANTRTEQGSLVSDKMPDELRLEEKGGYVYITDEKVVVIKRDDSNFHIDVPPRVPTIKMGVNDAGTIIPVGIDLTNGYSASDLAYGFEARTGMHTSISRVDGDLQTITSSYGTYSEYSMNPPSELIAGTFQAYSQGQVHTVGVYDINLVHNGKAAKAPTHRIVYNPNLGSREEIYAALSETAGVITAVASTGFSGNIETVVALAMSGSEVFVAEEP